MAETDTTLRSFVEIPPDSTSESTNLPFGSSGRGRWPGPGSASPSASRSSTFRCWSSAGCSRPEMRDTWVFHEPSLNAFLSMGRPAWREARQRSPSCCRRTSRRCATTPGCATTALLPAASVQLLLPARIGDYTDFYSSREHATNLGTMFRGPANALQPNWLHLPVGYTGARARSWSSGTDIRRPAASSGRTGADLPAYGPSRMMDFELEVGFLVGAGSELGVPVPIDRAAEHIFGLVLVNDWSARDIQQWSTAARAVPRQELRDLDLALGVTLEALEAVPLRRPAQATRRPALPRPPATAPSTSRSRCCCRARDGRAGACRKRQLRLAVLEHVPAARPPHRQRLQPPARRPDAPRVRSAGRVGTSGARCSSSPGAAPSR